jgi:hypothetical protein
MKFKEIMEKANRGEEVPYKFVHMLGGTVEGIGKVYGIICSGNDWKCVVHYNGKDYAPSKFSFDEVLVITNPVFAIAMLFYFKDWEAFYAKNPTPFKYSTDIPEGAIIVVTTETRWNNATLEMDGKDIDEIWNMASDDRSRSGHLIEVKCMNDKKQEGYVAYSLIRGVVDGDLRVHIEHMQHIL